MIDTHAWVWQLFMPNRLGAGALQVLTAADRSEARIIIPAVVLAEFLMIAEKRRVAHLTPEIVPQVIRAVRNHPGYDLMLLTPELVLQSQSFRSIPEIFDRLIVTEASQRG